MLPQALRLLSERNRRRCGVVLRLMWSPCGTHAARSAGSRRLCAVCNGRLALRSGPPVPRESKARVPKPFTMYASTSRLHQGYVLLSGFARTQKKKRRITLRDPLHHTSRATRALLVQQRCMTYRSSGVKPFHSCSIAANKKPCCTVTFFRDVRPRPRMP